MIKEKEDIFSFSIVSENNYDRFIKSKDQKEKSVIYRKESSRFINYNKRFPKRFQIYSLIFPDGKRYIGQTLSIPKILMEHRYHVFRSKGDGKEYSYPYDQLLKSKNKLIRHKLLYADERINCEILQTIDDINFLNKNENKSLLKEWIGKLDTYENGLNSTPGAKTDNNIFKINPLKVEEEKKGYSKKQLKIDINSNSTEFVNEIKDTDSEEIKEGKLLYRELFESGQPENFYGIYIGEGISLCSDGTYFHENSEDDDT